MPLQPLLFRKLKQTSSTLKTWITSDAGGYTKRNNNSRRFVCRMKNILSGVSCDDDDDDTGTKMKQGKFLYCSAVRQHWCTKFWLGSSCRNGSLQIARKQSTIVDAKMSRSGSLFVGGPQKPTNGATTTSHMKRKLGAIDSVTPQTPISITRVRVLGGPLYSDFPRSLAVIPPYSPPSASN